MEELPDLRFVQIALTKENYNKLWAMSQKYGYYLRENPRKRWANWEKSAAVRMMINNLIRNELEKDEP